MTSAFGSARCSRFTLDCAALVCVAPGRRYPTDLTDRQWALVEPMLPDTVPVAPGGRPPLYPKREIVNAILYLTRAGCAWRMLPKDLPHWRTVYGYFVDWRDDGTLDLIHDTLREELRKGPRSPTAPRGRPNRVRGSSIRSPCVGPTPSERTLAVMTPGSECREESAIS